ncbi:MAG: hypothetical protein ACTSPB_20625 [Candidatus Thorarchaeota archaeon]
MTKKETPQSYFMAGLIIIIMCIVSPLLITLIFLVPTILLAMTGLPIWPLLLISVPIGFMVLGWVFITIGGFRRKR